MVLPASPGYTAGALPVKRSFADVPPLGVLTSPTALRGRQGSVRRQHVPREVAFPDPHPQEDAVNTRAHTATGTCRDRFDEKRGMIGCEGARVPASWWLHRRGWGRPVVCARAAAGGRARLRLSVGMKFGRLLPEPGMRTEPQTKEDHEQPSLRCSAGTHRSAEYLRKRDGAAGPRCSRLGYRRAP